MLALALALLLITRRPAQPPRAPPRPDSPTSPSRCPTRCHAASSSSPRRGSMQEMVGVHRPSGRRASGCSTGSRTCSSRPTCRCARPRRSSSTSAVVFVIFARFGAAARTDPALLVLTGLAVIGSRGVFLEMRRKRRLRKFETQLPDALEPARRLDAGRLLVHAGTRGGRRGSDRAGAPRAAAGVHREPPRPAGRGCARGRREPHDSLDLVWAVMAIRIQREVGGNLAELLDTVARHDDGARAAAPRDQRAHRRGSACRRSCSASSRRRSRSCST